MRDWNVIAVSMVFGQYETLDTIVSITDTRRIFSATADPLYVSEPMHTAAHHLILHGSIVLLFGLLLGAPYAKAINRGAPPNIVNSWRVAHLSLPIGATLMLAVAAALPLMAIPTTLAKVIAVAFIVSAYGFCISTPLAALTGERGLSSGGAGLGRLVYLGNWVGAVASIVGSAALVIAAFLSL
jgi:hypothetical protein